MTKIISFILNIPWTLVGLLIGLVCIPRGVAFNKNLFVLSVKVHSLWISNIFMQRKINGCVMGNTILLSKTADALTYTHELVHINQFKNKPFIFPMLYWIELIKKGYQRNKYEIEAYRETINL